MPKKAKANHQTPPNPRMQLEVKLAPDGLPSPQSKPLNENQLLSQLLRAISKNDTPTFTALLNKPEFNESFLTKFKSELLKKILLQRNIQFLILIMNKGLTPTTEIEHDAIKDIFRGDVKNHSILLFAARYAQSRDIIIYLLGITLNTTDPEFRQKIINHTLIAVITNPALPNPAALIEDLIETYHADVKYGFPLSYAITRPQELETEEKVSRTAEIVGALLAAGADINVRIGHLRQLLIFYAIENPERVSRVAVQKLLEIGSYQNLRRLFQENNLKQIRSLLLHGLHEIKQLCQNSNPKINLPSDNPDDFDNSLLEKLVGLVVAKRINLVACVRDPRDLTNGLLHTNSNDEITELLLREGVPVEGRNRDGQTPFTRNYTSPKIFRAAQEYIAFHLEIKYRDEIDFSEKQVQQHIKELAEIVAPVTAVERFQPLPLTPASQQQPAQNPNYSPSSQEVARQIKSVRQHLIDTIPEFIQSRNHKIYEISRVTGLLPEIVGTVEELSPSLEPYHPEHRPHNKSRVEFIAKSARAEKKHVGEKRTYSAAASASALTAASSKAAFFAKGSQEGKNKEQKNDSQKFTRNRQNGSQEVEMEDAIKPAAAAAPTAAAAAAAAAANPGNRTADASASSEHRVRDRVRKRARRYEPGEEESTQQRSFRR